MASVTVMLERLHGRAAEDREAVALQDLSKAKLHTAPAVKPSTAARQVDATILTWAKEEVAWTADEVGSQEHSRADTKR